MIDKRAINWRGFYFITDHKLCCINVIEDVKLALKAQTAFVQYRLKDKDYPLRIIETKKIQSLCRQANIPFIINDDPVFARAMGADGVHIGQGDMDIRTAREILGNEAIIGVSVSSLLELEVAVSLGADYVAASPVFLTPTKEDAIDPVGIEGLIKMRAYTKLPLAAIGGINLSNIRQISEAGVDLFCAISASLANGTVTENINNLMTNTSSKK